jgi:hypothetical protein
VRSKITVLKNLNGKGQPKLKSEVHDTRRVELQKVKPQISGFPQQELFRKNLLFICQRFLKGYDFIVVEVISFGVLRHRLWNILKKIAIMQTITIACCIKIKGESMRIY